jgi:aspartate dehydrogenase
VRIGLIGYGNIGAALAARLTEDELCILVRPGRGEAVREACPGAEVVERTAALIRFAPDLVVECAGQGAVSGIVPDVLQAGFDTVVLSVGALADPATETALRDAAGKARLILAPGAIGGVDLLAALAKDGAVTVRYRGIKPPKAWAGTPAETLLDLDALTTATPFFEGTARDAARTYPKNANVAATLALAGAGFDATKVTLIADPAASGNRHEYDVEGAAGRFSMRIEGAASSGNARTSATTILSALREIDNFRGPVAI